MTKVEFLIFLKKHGFDYVGDMNNRNVFYSDGIDFNYFHVFIGGECNPFVEFRYLINKGDVLKKAPISIYGKDEESFLRIFHEFDNLINKLKE